MIIRCIYCDTDFHAGESIEFCVVCQEPVCLNCADEHGVCEYCAEEKRIEEIVEVED
jgi:hypothetical protein